MSWSVTIDDLDTIDPANPRLDQVLRKLSEDNPAYENDARQAFRAARASGLVSATLSGGRTPSPYGGPVSVVIAITGFDSRAVGHAVAKPFYQQTRENIAAGPDKSYFNTDDWDNDDDWPPEDE